MTEIDSLSSDLQMDKNFRAFNVEIIFAIFHLIMNFIRKKEYALELRMNPLLNGDIDILIQFPNHQERIQVKSRKIDQNCWNLSATHKGIFQLFHNYIKEIKQDSELKIKYILLIEGDVQSEVAKTFIVKDSSIKAIEEIKKVLKKQYAKNQLGQSFISKITQKDIKNFINNFLLIPRVDRITIDTFLKSFLTSKILGDIVLTLHEKGTLKKTEIKYLINGIGSKYCDNTFESILSNLNEIKSYSQIDARFRDKLEVESFVNYENNIAVVIRIGQTQGSKLNILFSLFDKVSLVAKLKAVYVTENLTYAIVIESNDDKVITKWEENINNSQYITNHKEYYACVTSPKYDLERKYIQEFRRFLSDIKSSK